MVSIKDHVLCVTCGTQLPPDREIKYFTQSPLFPHKDDLSFGDELFMLIGSMEALFNAIVYGNNEEAETDEALAKLGYEVAQEAHRRMGLLQEAQRSLELRYDTLRKQLIEQEG